MGTPRYVSAFWIVFVGGCSFSASCGGKLDIEKGEKVIAESLKQQTGMEATVSCPHNVPLKKGTETVCDVTIGGLPGKAKITQTDDKGNVDWDVVEGHVIMARAEKFLSEHLGKQIGQAVTLDCGTERLLVSEPGKVFRCKATAANGDVAQVEVTITDKQGGIDAKFVQ